MHTLLLLKKLNSKKKIKLKIELIRGCQDILRNSGIKDWTNAYFIVLQSPMAIACGAANLKSLTKGT